MSRARVAVVTTGGTIDSLGTDRLDLAAYLETGRRLEPGELLAGIPELALVAEVREVPFRRLRAHAMTDADLADLRDLVAGLLEGDTDGVVVTHGTNTLEETAWPPPRSPACADGDHRGDAAGLGAAGCRS
jgi:L-asparaginase